MAASNTVDIAAGLDYQGREHFKNYYYREAYDEEGNIHVFETLCSRGIKPEGQGAQWYDTPFEAAVCYADAFKKYLDEHPGNVYWRVYPELLIERQEEDTRSKFMINSRLCCSTKHLYPSIGEANQSSAPVPASKPSIIEKLVTTTANALNIYEQALTPATPEAPVAKAIPESAVPIAKRTEGWRARKGPQEWNESGFRATGHRVLLKTDEIEQFSPGGIALVSKTVNAEKNLAVVCTVVEIGYDAWSDKCTDYADAGDRVLIGQYVGKFHTSEKDGKEYRFVTDTDIISPIES